MAVTSDQRKEVKTFLAVPADAEVQVSIDNETFDLGFVHRVFATSDQYVVWEDREGRIWYETIERRLIKEEDFHKFWNRFQLSRVRSTQNLSGEAVLPYKQMLASAIASALEGQFMAAADALDAASDFLTTANERISRSRYTFGAVVATILSLGTSATLLPATNPASLLHLAGTAMLGGSLGALLSALAGRKTKLGFDPDASRLEGVFNGGLRVLYGVVAAFLVVLAIKSGAVSTPLISTEHESLSLIVVAAAGGFAERWAADLIRRFTTTPRSHAQ